MYTLQLEKALRNKPNLVACEKNLITFHSGECYIKYEIKECQVLVTIPVPGPQACQPALKLVPDETETVSEFFCSTVFAKICFHCHNINNLCQPFVS